MEEHEKVNMIPIAEKPVDSSLDSSESGASMKVIEFNEDGTVKKKMKDHVLEMVDLKKPMNRMGEATKRQLYSKPSGPNAANKRKKEKRKAKD